MRRLTLVYSGIALIMLLAGGLFSGHPAVAEDNSQTSKNHDGIIQACEMAGGVIEGSGSSDDRTNSNGGPSTSWATCVGGGMGGTTCTATNSGIGCTWKPPASRSMAEGTLQEVTINSDASTLVTELPDDAAIPFTAPPPESPMQVEAVVIWNPSVESAEQTGVNMVNGCQMLGGTGQVIHPDSDPESTSFTVQCDDGVIDGLWCAFGVGLSTCFFEPGTGPDAAATGDPTMTPTDAAMPTVTMPAEPPAQEPEASPTAAPTEPPKVTPTATSEPTPTDEPVIEPTFVPTDAGPWTVPEGTLPVLEPVEPTPTPVILT